ncbi:MAG: AbrB/MazE/SpoVT family DNA-binding domain-containing protein [Coriobacteriia bacterium]|nr:AbrB/MazE/SpoVT family DNA-binding domain-containing protein [Coriobacteriia bacterium]
MTSVTVSPKYQIVIPKLVRERLGVHPGDKIEILEPRPGMFEFFVPEKIDIKAMEGYFNGGPGYRVVHEERDRDRLMEP